MHINLHDLKCSSNQAFDIEYSKESTLSEELVEMLNSYICGKMEEEVPRYLL